MDWIEQLKLSVKFDYSRYRTSQKDDLVQGLLEALISQQ